MDNRFVMGGNWQYNWKEAYLSYHCVIGVTAAVKLCLS